MMIGAAVGLGLAGMMKGMNRVDAASAAIAGNNLDTANLAKSMVDQKIGELEVKASANVVKAADKMIGTIIDIRV